MAAVSWTEGSVSLGQTPTTLGGTDGNVGKGRPSGCPDVIGILHDGHLDPVGALDEDEIAITQRDGCAWFSTRSSERDGGVDGDLIKAAGQR